LDSFTEYLDGVKLPNRIGYVYGLSLYSDDQITKTKKYSNNRSYKIIIDDNK